MTEQEIKQLDEKINELIKQISKVNRAYLKIGILIGMIIQGLLTLIFKSI